MNTHEIKSNRWYKSASPNENVIFFVEVDRVTAFHYDTAEKKQSIVWSTTLDANMRISDIIGLFGPPLPGIGDIVTAKHGEVLEPDAIVVTNPMYDEDGKLVVAVYAELVNDIWLTYTGIDVTDVEITKPFTDDLGELLRKGVPA